MTEPSLSIPIQIQKLGAVDNANIILKPLTIFVGENSTGKTYSAYLISYIFSKYAFGKYYELIKSNKSKIKYKEIDSVIENLNKTGYAELNLKQFISNNSQKHFNLICNKVVTKDFKNFLASDTEAFNNVKVKLDLKKLKDIQYSHLSPHFLTFNVETCDDCDKINECKSTPLEIDKKDLILKFKRNRTCSDKEGADKKVYSLILQLLHRSVFNEVYFLGAERTGMALFYQTMRKYTPKPQNLKVDQPESEKDKIDGKRNTREIHVQFSQPAGELFNNVKSIFDPHSEELRKKIIRDEKEIKEFIEYANILETKILGGDITVTKNEDDTVKRIMFNYNTNSEIPLNMTISSSGVKGLSPLILYLKYFIEPNELIIIDEPEINLHPKAQVQLIELLSMLVNSKVNIIITTHSPYIVDHLINLMKAYSSKKSKKTLSNLFYLKNKDAFIAKDKVSVYLFEKGTAIDILEDENHINWKTFSQVSEDITDIYFKIGD